MKAKQRGEQHNFHFVFLGNKNNKKSWWQNSRDSWECVSKQQMCGRQENEQNGSLINRSLHTFLAEITWSVTEHRTSQRPRIDFLVRVMAPCSGLDLHAYITALLGPGPACQPPYSLTQFHSSSFSPPPVLKQLRSCDLHLHKARAPLAQGVCTHMCVCVCTRVCAWVSSPLTPETHPRATYVLCVHWVYHL